MRALALAAVVGAVVGAGAGAHAFCRTTTARTRVALGECTRSGVPLAWRNRCTGYSVHWTGSPELALDEVERVTLEATERWANVPCDENGVSRQYFRVNRNANTWVLSGYDAQAENANTISFRRRWGDNATHRVGTIAITIVTYDSLTGEIFDADIEMNQYDERANPDGFRFSTTRTVDPGSADLPTIMTHELGHFLGLAHSDNDRAVMWPEAGLGEPRRDLTADDSAGICEVYPTASAPALPGRVCRGVPYGGLATQEGGTKVVGEGCAVRPPHLSGRVSGGSLRGVALAALAGLAALAQGRRRRRGRHGGLACRVATARSLPSVNTD